MKEFTGLTCSDIQSTLAATLHLNTFKNNKKKYKAENKSDVGEVSFGKYLKDGASYVSCVTRCCEGNGPGRAAHWTWQQGGH